MQFSLKRLNEVNMHEQEGVGFVGHTGECAPSRGACAARHLVQLLQDKNPVGSKKRVGEQTSLPPTHPRFSALHADMIDLLVYLYCTDCQGLTVSLQI